MSKDLFANRLVIRIEENIPVGNNTASAQKSGSQYVPDITSTYKLSKDGRLQLRAYQKNDMMQYFRAILRSTASTLLLNWPTINLKN